MDKQLPWRQWMPEFVLLAAMWGSSFLFMREGVHAFGPFATAWVRVTIAALALMPFLIWRKQTGAMMHRWRPILLMGLLSSGVCSMLFVCTVIYQYRFIIYFEFHYTLIWRLDCLVVVRRQTECVARTGIGIRICWRRAFDIERLWRISADIWRRRVGNCRLFIGYLVLRCGRQLY